MTLCFYKYIRDSARPPYIFSVLCVYVVVGGSYPSSVAGSGCGTVLQELSDDDKDFLSVCSEVRK